MNEKETKTKKDSPLIFSKMINIMRKVEAIGKEQKNPAQHYFFRGIDDVYFALHNILANEGVITIPEILEERAEERQSSSGKMAMSRILKIRYRFYAEDGSFVDSSVIGEGADFSDKAANKAMSAAHKYVLLQTFCIPTEEPKDSEQDSIEMGKKKNESEDKKAMKPAAKTTQKSAQKPPAVQEPPAATEEPPPIEKTAPAGSEEEFMGGAKPPSKFDTAVLMTVKGERKKISYKEALEHFQTAKKFLGNKDYYQVLGNIGYEKSSELPFEKLDEVYRAMLKKYNDRKDFS